MKISFIPSNSNKNILDLIKNNKDIIFDLKGHSIFARGVEFKGTDTNTWRDIKINNVSIGSHTLDLRNGSNTTLTNTNGVVTINSTWRPVVDNLTSDSTTSSLSAKQGKVLKALIDGKSNSDHNHDGRYVRAFGTSNDNIDSDWGQSFKTFDPIPLGTPPEKNPNISLLSIGENFNKRKQLAFIGSNDNIYYRRRIDSGFTNWRRLAFANEIPTSLKNPYALTISLNGTSQGPYDGSAAKNINITPGSIGAAVSNHSHDYLVVNSADDKSFNSAYHNFQVLYAGGGNGITGRPANVDAFGLFKFRAANGYSGQMLLASEGSLYIRSSEDAKMTNTLAWKTILDSSNYSGILDSRYYTESEVNSLLDAKLNRQNLSYSTWNPRGYHLAADYHYNGGDLSISESGGQIHVSVDGYFWQNEGQYRVLDTSDVAGLKSNLTLYQYLSATDAAWYPLVWGGDSHLNTSASTGTVFKSYDKLCWQTSRQTLYATNIQTNNIKNLSIEGGIYWNPYVESASDGSNVASITLVRSGVAGGTTLVLSQMNDTNDTIQFKTNTAARLYHNSYPILTTQNTYVSNNKGYINGTEITQVNNSDTLDNWHKDNIQWTGYITSADSLSSYWFKMYQITVTGYQYNDITITFLVSEGYSEHFSIFHLKIRQNGTNHSGNYNLVVELRELVGNLRDKVVAYYNNSTGDVQLWGNPNGKYNTMNYTVLKKTTRIAKDSSSLGILTAQTFSSVQTPPSTGYTRVTMASVGSVANAYHLRINAANTWSTWYWAGQSGQPNWLWGSNDGTNMYVWNPNNFNVNTAQYLRSLGNQNCQTERTQAYGDVYSYNTHDGNTGSPTTYSSVIGFGRGIAGTVEIAGGWCNTHLYWRSLRDCCEDWFPWRTVLDSSNYTEFINNYYWANVKISASSSTTTSPTFSNVYLGNSLYLNNRGPNSIYNGPNDSANGVGGPLNNLVFSSWWGVSFTTSCSNQTYTNKTAVSINCRTGQLYAREVQANGFMHTGHNNNDAVLLAGGGYKTLKDFIFLNKSYNYADNEHYNLNFHKLSGICNNLVWVDGHVKGYITKTFVIDTAVFPYRYDRDSDLGTTYLMTGNNYITINAVGVVTINNATNHKQRVGFFYTGRA